MKKRDLEKLLQNSLPKQPPDLWDRIEQSYFIEGELPPVKKHVPWYRYAAAAACVGFAVLVGAQLIQKVGIKPTAKNSESINTAIGSVTEESDSTNSDTEPQIISNVDDTWKEKYTDITITNELLEAVTVIGLGVDSSDVNNSRIVILFGSLKSTPRKGAVRVITMNGDGSVVDERIYLSPEEHGALTVVDPGSKNSGIVAADEDGIRWNLDLRGYFKPIGHTFTLPQIHNPSNTGKTDTRPQVIGDIDSGWKENNEDITITNGWLSAQLKECRTIVLCGSLKSDPQQGVADVITVYSDGSVAQRRFVTSQKRGALTVGEVGAKDFSMFLIDEDGLKWNFNIYNGFDPSTPVS